MPTAELAEKLERLAQAGADYVIFYVPRVAYDHEPMQRIAEDVIPRFS